MFEQKIPTVSMHVNNESFAVVPFDNYEDAIKAAKNALVALNGNDAMQSLIDRLCSVEMALAEEKARNTTVLKIDGDLLRTLSFTERQRIELDQEPPKVAVIEPVAWGRLNVFGVLNDTTCIKDDAQKWKDAGFKVVPLIDPTETAKPGAKLGEKPEGKAEKQKIEPKGWLRESINGVTRAITTEPEVAEIWVAAGRKVTPLYE